MSVEKIKILKMLEEGKISAEDAAKLLSLTDGAPAESGRTGQSAPGSTYTHSSGSYTGSQTNNQRPASSGSSFAEDLGKKFDTFMRDIEPKLRSFSEVVVEKTAAAADSLSKSFIPSPRQAERPSGYSAPSGPGDGSVEIKVSSPYSELDFSSLNGQIQLTGYNGDKITATVRSKQRRRTEKAGIMVLGNKYILQFDDGDYDAVSVTAYIPYNMFKYIRLSSVNGDIHVSGIDCEEITVSNSNAILNLNNLRGKSLFADCQNCKELKLSGLCFGSAEIESSNGAVYASENDIENLKLVAFNAPVSMNLSEFKNFSNYLWIIETSNQKLGLYVPTTPAVGYYIKGATTLGNIKIGLTGLNFIYNDTYNTEAKSIHFDSAPKKVRISLETSNAALIVN